MLNNDYRGLTESEIRQLERNGCRADNWADISVADDFDPQWLRNVSFHGSVELGSFDKNMTVDEGFSCHTGIYNAMLSDVSVGDNCLILNIGAYIHNTDIGEDTCVANVGRISSAPDATFGQGTEASILNEAGPANAIIFDRLTAQLATLVARHAADHEFMKAYRRIVADYIELSRPQRGYVGSGCKITGVGEIANSIVADGCEVSGATLIDDTTLAAVPGVQESVYVGSNVILKSCVVAPDASIIDGANLQNCFVDSGCRISGGLNAESSLIFACSQLACGEVVASLCGPFTVSHHKSSLLIGGHYSFYNAGSGTNFSNHAYKSGPVHWGTMERGSKTASGSHLLWPARIGAFTMCMGKIATHPDTRSLPFSYLFGQPDGTACLLPGRNFATLGTQRDTQKWPNRDLRPKSLRRSLVCYDWLNPLVATECLEGLRTLQKLREDQGYDQEVYTYNGTTISAKHLVSGMQSYEEILYIYLYRSAQDREPEGDGQMEQWTDLGGLLMPEAEEQRLVADIAEDRLDSLKDIEERFADIQSHYDDYKWRFTCALRLSELFAGMSTDDIEIHTEAAVNDWKAAVNSDANKEQEIIDKLEY